jgi:hypothetical protein
MEIINDAQVEPHRLRVMLRLVSDLDTPTRVEVSYLAQLPVLLEDPSSKNPPPASEVIHKIAVNCGQISENSDKTLSLLVEPEQITTMPSFQDHMRQVLLGITEESQSNYKLNLFSAWYAVQNEHVLYRLVHEGYDVAFNKDMAAYVSLSKDRLFNTTKLNGWRKWAKFLGLGWIMTSGSHDILVPDATKRVKAVLPEIFLDDGILSFGLFMERLASLCPELDGGKLFDYCWQISRGTELRGNRLSLMLSTALRTLATLHIITLINEADSTNVWTLFPAEGSSYKHVTHIQRQEA